MILIPKVLLDLFDDHYECAFLLGKRVREYWIVDALAFVHAEIGKSFRCIPPLRHDVIGVIHSHPEEHSGLDKEASKAWSVYLIKTGRALRGFEQGMPSEVILL